MNTERASWCTSRVVPGRGAARKLHPPVSKRYRTLHESVALLHQLVYYGCIRSPHPRAPPSRPDPREIQISRTFFLEN